MKQVLSATEARIHFGELLRQVVENQQPVIVERDGQPQVVVLSLTQYEALVAGQRVREDWKELVRQARDQIRSEPGERELAPSEEIIRQMREERDAQLLGLR